jgi:hypothetical protein
VKIVVFRWGKPFQKAILGSADTSLAQRQVTFSDTEGTCSKGKESSHMQRQACLEQEKSSFHFLS